MHYLSKMKFLFVSLFLFLFAMGPRPAYALTALELWQETKDELVLNSRFAFLDQAQLGWAWDLKADDFGGPAGVLDIYQYRFFILSIGWTGYVNRVDPNSTTQSQASIQASGIPIILGGIHLDKLVRLIAPGASDTVRSVIPDKYGIRKVWDILTVSYGPGWDLDKQPKDAITHFVSVNFQFGGTN